MASLIQLRRSLTTAIPASLANGEPAYTANGDVLYIGSNGTMVAIAGLRVPGTTTANQAMVVDANGMIDIIRHGNTTVNSVVNSTAIALANSTVTLTIVKPTLAEQGGANYLRADGTWAAASGGAADPAGSNTHIQFNDSASMGGSAGFTYNKTTNNVLIGNTLTVSVITMGNSTANVFANSILIQTSNSTGIANLTPTALTVGTSVVNTTQIAAGANVLISTADVKIGNSTVNVHANSVLITIANASARANVTPTSVIVGTTVVNTTQITVAGGPTINSTTISVTDLNVSGNLVVLGGVTTVDTTNLVVSDPMIRLADDQANTGTFVDSADIGYFGTFGNTSQTGYTGLFRDASDSGVYKLFAGQIPVPTTTVDTANVNFAFAKLQAYLKTGTGSGVFEANATGTTITANSTWAVAIAANTLSLSTALPGTSGGLGLATYTAEDVIVANSTNGFRKLSVGAEGTLLQVSGGVVAYGTLDGGTF
jgi:hypothetical protein